MVKTLPSNAGDACSIPGGGGKIPCALWPKNPPKMYNRNNTVINSVKTF